MTSALFLCACSIAAPKQPESSEQPSEETDENVTAEPVSSPESEDVTEKPSLWAVEPSMKLDDVDSLKAVPMILGAQIEFEGNPMQWYQASPSEAEDVADYRTDVICASYEGKYGIMDFDGNVIYPFMIRNDSEWHEGVPVAYQPYAGWITFESNGTRQFSADFTKRSYYMFGGIGGYAPAPFVRDHQAWIYDDAAGDTIAYTNTTGRNVAAQVSDANDQAIGCSVISPDSEIIFESDGYCGSMANGFVKIYENNDWNNPGRQGFVRVRDGAEITGGAVYDEVQPFVNGYAPVKKDGKWAFIDEDGALVSEFLFDDASGLYEGKAYVEYQGLYGILDIASAHAQGIMIDDSSLAGDYHEKALEIPESHEGEPIGKVKVLVDNLNSRGVPEEYGEKLEKVKKGEEYIVYEIFKGTNYTWYRIDEQRWIADDGSWVQYTAD